MPHRPFPHALDEPARKWRALAERRRAHFVELYQTGRWRHYYSPDEFLKQLRGAVAIADRWAQLAPRQQDRHQAAE